MKDFEMSLRSIVIYLWIKNKIHNIFVGGAKKKKKAHLSFTAALL